MISDLIDRGYRVHVAAPQLSADQATTAWLNGIGAQCHDVALSRTGLNPLSDMRTMWALVRLIRHVCPQTVIAYTIKPVVWGMLAAALCRVPRRVALITGLGYAFIGEARGRRAFIRRLAHFLYRRALAQATTILFQNPDDRATFASMQLLPVHATVAVINGSGIDTAVFTPQPFPALPVRFLLIARLLGDKGVREYVAAAAQVRDRYPDAQFALVGPLDLQPSAIPASEVQSWCDAGVVEWAGELADVRGAIADAHVYVLPSYGEGTPRSVLEAMAMGRPVITTDVPGCRETVVDGDNGYLVPVRDAEALAEAMMALCADPDRIAVMGARSRAIALDKYEVGKVNLSIFAAAGLSNNG
jgi:glycosyltransferase involved in cell wall biosynthesis